MLTGYKLKYLNQVYISQRCIYVMSKHVQSTHVISKSTGLSEIVRGIRTSTYQNCRFEEKKIEQPHLTNENVIWLLKLEISPLFHNIFNLLLDFHVRIGTRGLRRDKRLVEISEIEIKRVDCTWMLGHFNSSHIIIQYRNLKNDMH